MQEFNIVWLSGVGKDARARLSDGSTADNALEHINAMGRDGWQLFQALTVYDNTHVSKAEVMMIFQKEVKPPKHEPGVGRNINR